MKKRYITFILIFCLAIIGTYLFTQRQNLSNPIFFMQYENYIAASQEENLELALSFWGDKDEVNKAIEAIGVSFDDKAIEITKFEINTGDQIEKLYSGALYIICSFLEDGVRECSTISLTYPDNTTKNFPIGQWIFDVDKSPCADVPIDVWSSPVASTDRNCFSYSYLLEQDSLEIESIQYGKDLYHYIPKDEKCCEINGTLTLPGEAPVKYIRPKLHITYAGTHLVTYGMGCYCGAFNVTLDEIMLSQQIAMNKK